MQNDVNVKIDNSNCNIMALLLAANIGVPVLFLLSDIAFGKENFNPFHQSKIYNVSLMIFDAVVAVNCFKSMYDKYKQVGRCNIV